MQFLEKFFRFKGELITIKEGDTIGDFKVIDTPGHTIGSKSFYDEKDKILMSGDTLLEEVMVDMIYLLVV